MMVSPLVSSQLLSRPSSPLSPSLSLRPSVREKRVENEGGGRPLRDERDTNDESRLDKGFPFLVAPRRPELIIFK